MLGSLLSGFVNETGNQVQAVRDRARQQEEQELTYRRTVLDRLMGGMLEGSVDPQHFGRALEEYLGTNSRGRKLKGGMAGFGGSHEMPLMPFFESVMRGGMQNPPTAQGMLPVGGTSPMGSMPQFSPGGTDPLRAAEAGIPAQGPSIRPQDLFISPQEQGRRTTAGQQQGHYQGIFEGLLGVYGGDRAKAQAALEDMIQKTSNPWVGSPMQYEDTDPATGKKFWGTVMVDKAGGVPMWLSGPLAGQPIGQNATRVQQPIIGYGPGGGNALQNTPNGVVASGINLPNGSPIAPGGGVVVDVNGQASVWNRYQTGPLPGVYAGANPGQVSDDAANFAREARKQLDQDAKAYMSKLEGIDASMYAAEEQKWREAEVARRWGNLGWTWEAIQQLAPMPGQVNRPVGGQTTPPAPGAAATPTPGAKRPAARSGLKPPPAKTPTTDSAVRSFVERSLTARAGATTTFTPAQLKEAVDAVMKDPTLKAKYLAQMEAAVR